jgi:hypothetical protein
METTGYLDWLAAQGLRRRLVIGRPARAQPGIPFSGACVRYCSDRRLCRNPS